MKEVTFSRIETISSCVYTTGSIKDMSGPYVPAAVARQMLEALETIRDFPDENYPRRTEDGYPLEIAYDEYAYKRIIYTYREFAKQAIAAAKGG